VSNPSAFKIPAAPRVEESRTPPATIPDGTIPPTKLPTDPQSMPRTMPKSSNSSTSAYTAARTKALLRGEVVTSDRATPRPDTKIIFINAANEKVREEARTNAFGEFDVNLPAGEWYVYLGQGNGRAVYHKKLSVKSDDVRDMTLVSR
jgi:hypothetical protein